MKRVCIYCQTWESGGIEAFISNMLSHMDLFDIKIDIVVDVLKESVFTDNLKSLGITFRELSGSQRSVVKNYRLFAKLISKQKYDVLHLNVFQALPLAYLLLAKRKGISVRIAHSHNTMLRRSKTRMLKMAVHKIVSWAFSKESTDLWACSDNAAKFMFPAPLLKKKEYRFIPNGIDLERFKFNEAERENIRNQLHLEKSFVIGNVGRLCYQKNQSFLLDTFARVYSRDISARLLLVGKGDDFKELEEKATKLSISDAVIFWGTTPNIEKLLWAMDVFVFPSVFEGLGIAAIEAQAAGLPTLCSDIVPPETLATPLAHMLPISVGCEAWAEKILEIRTLRRQDERERLYTKGYEIADVAQQIENEYRGNAFSDDSIHLAEGHEPAH